MIASHFQTQVCRRLNYAVNRRDLFRSGSSSIIHFCDTDEFMYVVCTYVLLRRPSRCEFFAGVLRVPCTEHLQRTRNERVRSLSRHVGVILLSGGWGSMWGSSRGLQVFYVIPGSGVIVQIYIEKNWTLHDVQGDQLNMVVCFWHLVKSDLWSVQLLYSSVHWTSNFLQGTTKTCFVRSGCIKIRKTKTLHILKRTVDAVLCTLRHKLGLPTELKFSGSAWLK